MNAQELFDVLQVIAIREPLENIKLCTNTNYDLAEIKVDDDRLVLLFDTDEYVKDVLEQYEAWKARSKKNDIQ